MMRASSLAAAAVAAFSAGACAWIVGIEDDPAASDVAPGDGGTGSDGNGSSSGSGSNGGTTPDDASTSETDASSDAPFDAPVVCSSPSFCDSFERASPQGDWPTAFATLETDLTLDGRAASGQKSLRILLPARDSRGAQSSAGLTRTFAGAARPITWSFSVLLPTTAREVHMMSLAPDVADAGSIDIVVDGFAALFVEEDGFGSPVSRNGAGTITGGVWHRFVLTVALTTMTLTVDGTQRYSGPLKYFPPSAAGYRATAGVRESFAGNAAEVLVDDVRFDPP
jgi:hypothetical protein